MPPDALAYGMHLVYEGSHADPSRLADAALVRRVVVQIAELLGAEAGEGVQRRQAETLYRPVEEAFAVGRSTSRRAARARAPQPDDLEALERRLAGERAYAEARFAELDPPHRG
jgi:hypothetical protein